MKAGGGAKAARKPKKVARVRRSAEEARAAILDAAERQLLVSGPAGIRLMDVGAEVGISHPAVLHHFGSREGLVEAVVTRAVERLALDLSEAIASAGGSKPDGVALFEIVSAFEREHGRLIAWLLLAGYDPLASKGTRAAWRRISDAMHELRLASAPEPKPSLEDTRFAIMLSALALFGQAVAGRASFEAAGLDTSEACARRFRAWLAMLLAKHLSGA